jgi:short-subunit dehydrogenase
VVAGGTTGIGLAFSRLIAERGLNVFIIARRTNLLDEAARAIRQDYGVEVRTASLDLGQPDILELVEREIAALDIGLVVYNACHSTIGPFLDESDDSRLETIYVNCRAPMLFSSYFGKYLAAKGRGGIILMSSMAGWQGSSMVTSYAATKAFNTVLGEGLWRELAPSGVDVLVNIAGATLTPTFKAQTPPSNWKNAFPSSPEDVAREGLEHLPDSRAKGPVHIAGRMNRIVHALFGKLSRRAAVTFMAKNTEELYRV